MITIFALLGAKALWLTYIWLLGAILASWLSHRKGYGEKAGLVTGLLLSIAGPILWLFVPAKAESRWKRYGPFGKVPKHAADAPAPEPPAGAAG